MGGHRRGDSIISLMRCRMAKESPFIILSTRWKSSAEKQPSRIRQKSPSSGDHSDSPLSLRTDNA